MRMRARIACTMLLASAMFISIATASISASTPDKTDINISNNIVIQPKSIKKASEFVNDTNELLKEQVVYTNNIVSNDSLDNIEISDCIVIGDSNTVRMDMYNTEISKAKHISAIVGVGVGGFSSYTNSSNTTSGRTLKSDLDRLNSEDFNNVIVMLGTNDFNKDENIFKEQYKSVLDYIYTRNNKSNIYMVTVPPVNDSKSPSIQDDDADDISRFIQEIANEYTKLDIEVIDLNNYLSSYDMSSSYGDGYHFSKSGADKAAKYIIENL